MIDSHRQHLYRELVASVGQSGRAGLVPIRYGLVTACPSVVFERSGDSDEGRTFDSEEVAEVIYSVGIRSREVAEIDAIHRQMRRRNLDIGTVFDLFDDDQQTFLRTLTVRVRSTAPVAELVPTEIEWGDGVAYL